MSRSVIAPDMSGKSHSVPDAILIYDGKGYRKTDWVHAKVIPHIDHRHP